MKKIIIPILVLVIIAVGYFYYIIRIQPISFVSSFCETLEYDGPDSFELWDYLLSDFDITPLQSWEEFYSVSKEKYPNLSKGQLFKIWKDVYLSRCADYVYVSLEYPKVNAMTREMFKNAYDNFRFSHFKFENKEFKNEGLNVSGYVDVKYKGSYLGKLKFEGNKKFDLIAQNGSLGWKIKIFSIED